MTTDAMQVQFVSKEKVAHDTWRFLFIKPPEFSFIAGQFVTVFLGNDTRDFTICADPQDPKYFSIITKTGTSVFKKQLFLLPKGTAVTMKYPAGGFILHENTHSYVFLAGGVGLTVFYSIIKDVISNSKRDKIILIASFSKKEDIFFYDELHRIESAHKNIQIIYTLSQDVWEGETGRISEALLKKYVPQFKDTTFMIAGGEEMVEDTESLLSAMGVDSSHIRIDIFTGY